MMKNDPCFRRRPVSHGSRRRFARLCQTQFLALYRHALAERLFVQLSAVLLYEPRLVTIKVSNGYGGYYFKKVWKDVKVCY